jgi:Ca2+-binding EF-hand superfamily protein
MSLATLLLSLALGAPVEAGKPEAPKAAHGTEVQDLLLLHEEGPLRIRMRITNGDKSVFARWHDHMERWFKYADRDNSGFIEPNELERVPSVAQMVQMMQTGQFFAPQQLGGVAGQGAVTLKEMDLDGDGKIDRHEFITFYAGTQAGPLQVVAGYNNFAAQGINSGILSDTLFRVLDANKDGRLSREELSRAAELLARFDLNDDEIISAQELLGGSQFGQQFGQPVQYGGNAFALNLVPLPREASDLRLTARLKFAKDLVTRLDADRSGGLDRKEFRIPAAEFDKLDTNHDGQLDALELVKWLVGPPDIEVTVRMETLVGNDNAIEVKGTRVRVEKNTTTGVNFNFGDASIQLDRNGAQGNRGAFNAGANMKQYFVQIFGILDSQKTGKVSLEEINKNPQANYLRTMGKWLDMDGDGFVTIKEIEDFIELTSGGAQSQLSIGFLDQGRGLFEILDTTPDGQLSIGELKAASKVLSAYIKPGADALERTDIPRRYSLVVAQGNNNGGQMMMPGGLPRVRPPQPGVIQNPGRGPAWFQKMDVNGDGYVSPREFLGPMTLFKQIDTDGDGLISHEEATRYEEEQKAKKAASQRKTEPIPEPPVEKP